MVHLTPVHGALAALLVTAFTAGVVLAPRSVCLAGDLHAFLYVLDLVILFVVVLAAVRTIGVRRVVDLTVWGSLGTSSSGSSSASRGFVGAVLL